MPSYLLLSILIMATIGLSLWCLRLRHELQAALTDQTYGILTRAGGERAWKRLGRRYSRFEVVFLDLDALHLLNAELGYMEVDRRIRASLSHRHKDIVTARWYSGDEIVAVVPKGDGFGFSRRLLAGLKAQGLSATFGVVPSAPLLADAVRQAMDLVTAAKLANRRGTVCGSEACLRTDPLTPRVKSSRRATLAPHKAVQP